MWRARMALTLALTGSAVRPWLHDSSHMATHYGNTLHSIHSARNDVKTNESNCAQWSDLLLMLQENEMHHTSRGGGRRNSNKRRKKNILNYQDRICVCMMRLDLIRWVNCTWRPNLCLKPWELQTHANRKLQKPFFIGHARLGHADIHKWYWSLFYKHVMSALLWIPLIFLKDLPRPSSVALWSCCSDTVVSEL